ncbi:MAG: hypothetical protein AAGF12_36625, partial [Myxococcota bacterium]
GMLPQLVLLGGRLLRVFAVWFPCLAVGLVPPLRVSWRVSEFVLVGFTDSVAWGSPCVAVLVFLDC